jgi:hypothetical protein
LKQVRPMPRVGQGRRHKFTIGTLLFRRYHWRELAKRAQPIPLPTLEGWRRVAVLAV